MVLPPFSPTLKLKRTITIWRTFVAEFHIELFQAGTLEKEKKKILGLRVANTPRDRLISSWM